jgi:hypothetical protein
VHPVRDTAKKTGATRSTATGCLITKRTVRREGLLEWHWLAPQTRGKFNWHGLCRRETHRTYRFHRRWRKPAAVQNRGGSHVPAIKITAGTTEEAIGCAKRLAGRETGPGHWQHCASCAAARVLRAGAGDVVALSHVLQGTVRVGGGGQPLSFARMGLVGGGGRFWLAQSFCCWHVARGSEGAVV